jgi:hypothetical protein
VTLHVKPAQVQAILIVRAVTQQARINITHQLYLRVLQLVHQDIIILVTLVRRVILNV